MVVETCPVKGDYCVCTKPVAEVTEDQSLRLLQEKLQEENQSIQQLVYSGASLESQIVDVVLETRRSDPPELWTISPFKHHSEEKVLHKVSKGYSEFGSGPCSHRLLLLLPIRASVLLCCNILIPCVHLAWDCKVLWGRSPTGRILI